MIVVLTTSNQFQGTGKLPRAMCVEWMTRVCVRRRGSCALCFQIVSFPHGSQFLVSWQVASCTQTPITSCLSAHRFMLRGEEGICGQVKQLQGAFAPRGTLLVHFVCGIVLRGTDLRLPSGFHIALVIRIPRCPLQSSRSCARPWLRFVSYAVNIVFSLSLSDSRVVRLLAVSSVCFVFAIVCVLCSIWWRLWSVVSAAKAPADAGSESSGLR